MRRACALGSAFLGVLACSAEPATSGGAGGVGGSGATGGSASAGSPTSPTSGGAGGTGGTPNEGRAGAASAGRGGATVVGGSASSTGGAANSAGLAGMAAGEAGAPNAGAPGRMGCSGRDYLLCEDFENTALGAVPDGWTRHGDQASVDDAEARGGSRALKLGATASGERRIYHDAKLLGRAHWGRIYYKLQTPVPDAFVHSTLVALLGDGPKNGRSEYRPIDTVKQAKDTPNVGGRHNFIYNVQIIGKSEFGTETSYDYTFDSAWHCAEYHLDAADQSYTLYFDGKDVLHFAHGAGNYADSDIPDEFTELRVGWNNYQSAPPGFTAFIDDVAFDDARIGCD